MKRLLIFLLWIFALFSAISCGLSRSETSEASVSDRNSEGADVLEHPPTNSLLPTTSIPNTALVAALDGTIYLVELNSGKIVWSFGSGSPIYASYQALYDHDSDDYNTSDPVDFFVDCGDDWELFMQGPSNKKVKLPLNAEEFISRTPIITADGGVILGSKNTTVFLVDSKSGKVIYTFRLGEHPSENILAAEENPIMLTEDFKELLESRAVDFKHKDQSLYVLRTDYTLKYFSRKTGKNLWYLMFSDIDASFPCQEMIRSFGEGFFGPEDELRSERKGGPKLPFSCGRRTPVLRIRDNSLLESLLRSHELPIKHPGGRILSLPAPVLKPVGRLPGAYQSDEGNKLLALPPTETESGILALPTGDTGETSISSAPEFSARSLMWAFLVLFLFMSVVAFLFLCSLLTVGKLGKIGKGVAEQKVKAVTLKKKKARKSGINKNGSSIETIHQNVLQEVTGEISVHSLNSRLGSRGNKSLLIFSNPVDEGTDSRKIGKLVISNKEIAKGSNGTVVLEGMYDGRLVAVKRLVQSHHDVALKEIQNLIASDCHPNIVRWFGVEYDQDFIYLSLERCSCSLGELIYSYSTSCQNQVSRVDQDPKMKQFEDIELWKPNGHPSPQLLKLMRDIVSGLAHLHELGIVHRDLKPQNVLIIKERYLSAKISDMGISKCLSGDMSTLTQAATGYGSSGWQAPEQLNHGRQTRALDLFSLGCVFFFCLAGGKHPFGDILERDVNIVKDRKDLFLVESNPEAMDLIHHLLDPNPNLRPKAVDVLHHPFFWNSEMRLSFLRDASDRVELENREGESELLKALESIAPLAFGCKWDEKIESAFINDIGRYRRYKFDSVRDLLRVIRNKLNHYRELSPEIQGILGPVPEGFGSYFSSRFPKLLIEVYKVIHKYCSEEESLCKYFRTIRI